MAKSKEVILVVYFKAWELEEKIIKIVGIEEDGSGTCFATMERDVSFTLSKEKAKLAVLKLKKKFKRLITCSILDSEE